MTSAIERKPWSNTKSMEWWERAQKVTTFGQTNLRKFSLMNKPIYVERAKGARLWDVDGNEYVDFANSGGPAILGHSHPDFVPTMHEQLDTYFTGATGITQTTMEVELSEKIVQHFPCAEKVRFGVSGTEVGQLLIRLARAFTRRPMFVRFEGHYHGSLDNVMGGLVNPDPTAEPFPIYSDGDLFTSEGQNPQALQEAYLLPWNDIEVLENTLKNYGEKIALVMMEPVMTNGMGCPPRPGYLEKVRELCTQYGVLLAFDEVISGFRSGLAGLQGEFNVIPDLTMFGKAFAGGFPVAAVAGRRDIMDLLDDRRVVGAGTLNGFPYGMAAALATMKVLEKDNGAIFEHIGRMQNRLTEGLKEICQRRGVPLTIQGPRGIFFSLFTETDSGQDVAYTPRDLSRVSLETQGKFTHTMVEKGVLTNLFARWYVSGALEDSDIDFTLAAADSVLADF